MQSFKKSFDHLVTENPSQLILGVIFVLYILLNVQTPYVLAGPIDTIFGKVLVMAVAAVIFMKTNPVVGVLGFVVAYQLIKTASIVNGTYAKKHYLPSEANKMKEMQSFNEEYVVPSSSTTNPNIMVAKTNNDGALEAEMVAKLAPLVMHGSSSDSETMGYSPIMDGQHSAALLTEI
jgi:hypothetical protein